MKRIKILILILVMLGFSHCDNNKQGKQDSKTKTAAGIAALANANQPPSSNSNRNPIVLDEETRGLTTSINDDFTSIQFSSNTAQFKTLSVGDVVIGDDTQTQGDKGKGSYIVRIKSIDWTNNTLLTEFLPLDDAIQGKWQVTSESSEVVLAKALTSGIQTSVADGQVVVDFDETVDFGNGIKIGGKITLTSYLKLLLDFENGLKNVDFTCRIVSTKQLRMNVKDANIKKKFGKDLIKYIGKPIKVYGLLYITPVITLRMEVDVDGTITLNTSISKTSTFKTALKYTKAGGWVTEKDVTNSETTSSVDASGSGSVKVGLGPQISLVLMNRVSAFSNIFATGKGEVSVDPVYSDIIYAIFGGYRVDMGIGIDMFGRNLGFKVEGLLANESQLIGGVIKTPPKIEILSEGNITSSSATIKAEFNRPASIEVKYGVNESNLSLVKKIGTLNASHTILLESLASKTKYFYKVIAILGDKKTESAINSFTTLEVVPPGNKPELAFSNSIFTLEVGTPSTISPSKAVGIDSCKSEPALANGLSLSSNCTLYGVPITVQANTTYVLSANNVYGTATATISIQVKDKPSTLNFLATTYNLTKSVITQIFPTISGSITSCTSVPAMPAGLSLNSTTCAITGIPTVTLAATSFTVTASNSGGVATDTFTMTIVDQVNPKPELVYPSSNVAFTAGVYESLTPRLASNISSCTITPILPTGLTIACSSGVISGTASTGKVSTLHTITVKNAFGDAATTTLWIEVKEKTPTVDFTSSNYNLTKGVFFQATPTTTGKITSCASTPALPSGLLINQTTCEITGTPTVTLAATYFTVSATNNGGTATDTYSLAVNEKPNTQPNSPVFISLQCFPWLNSTYTASIKAGYDEDGDKVRIRCQITGTQYGSSDPAGQYVSPYVNGLDKIDFSVKFTSLGFQTFACRTEDEKGAVSNYWEGVSGLCNGSSIKVVPYPY